MIKERISISPCEVKQLNTAPCDADEVGKTLLITMSALIYFARVKSFFSVIQSMWDFSISVYLKSYRK